MAADPRLLTAEELDEIRRCVDAAPPGPYEHYQSNLGFWHIVHPGERNRILADLPRHPCEEAIAALMAHSRQDVPALLAHIATTAALLAEAQAALEPFADEFRAGNPRRRGEMVEFAPNCDALRCAAEVWRKMREAQP